jgi:hypothetical protein
MPYLVGYITPQDYGAVGNGTTDDTAAVQAALNAAGPSGVVLGVPGSVYATSSPLYIPPQVTFTGSHGAHLDSLVNPAIKPLASFSGAAVILLVDQTTGGYSIVSNEQRISYLTIEGSALPASVDGIQAQGYVHGVYLTEVAIRDVTGHGIATVSNSSGTAYSWRGTRVRVYNSTNISFSVSMTDCTWIDCEAIQSGSNGWFLGACANTHLIGCRSEFSTNDGFNISGSTGTGTGSGGFTMTDCSTDRSGHNGVFFSSLTGDGPVIVTGLMTRRDGRNGNSGGGNYAGLQITATTAPVTINGMTCYPGVDDNGSGTNSPQYGVSVTSGSTKVTLDNLFLQANTTAFNDDGTNTGMLLGSTVQFYTGATSSPVAAASPGVTTTSAGTLYTPGHALGIVHPQDVGLSAWVFDPANVASGKAGVAGTMYLAGLYVANTFTATKLLWGINTVGATITANENFVGLYSGAGTRLASVDVDARVTTTGMFTETISAALTPGLYWVAFMFNAGTMPSVYRGQDLNATLMNAAATTATLRFCTNGTSLTTSIPSSITPSSNVAAQFSYWAALG